MITQAEHHTLQLIAQHGKAIRVYDRLQVYTWRIAGEAKSRTIDNLLNKGVLQLSKDRSTATLSPRGKAIMRQAA